MRVTIEINDFDHAYCNVCITRDLMQGDINALAGMDHGWSWEHCMAAASAALPEMERFSLRVDDERGHEYGFDIKVTPSDATPIEIKGRIMRVELRFGIACEAIGFHTFDAVGRAMAREIAARAMGTLQLRDKFVSMKEAGLI